MSTANRGRHGAPIGGGNEKRRQLARYLESKVEDGKMYFKSKFISNEIEMSPREIGTNMRVLAEESEKLDIVKWSHAKATTWRVEKESETE